MKKIVLMCAQGMSTGVLVNKMREAAAKEGYDCTIEAHAVAQAHEYADKADVILLGPQVRLDLDEVTAQCPNVPTAVIDMMAYGRMDGAKVIKQAKSLMGD